MSINRNQIANARNEFQGSNKRVLTVCSAGLLRSPTIAWILSNPPFNFNTRSCGAAEEYALIPLTPALVWWAEDIITVERWQTIAVHKVLNTLREANIIHQPEIIELTIPDQFNTRSPELVTLATEQLTQFYEKNMD